MKELEDQKVSRLDTSFLLRRRREGRGEERSKDGEKEVKMRRWRGERSEEMERGRR